MAYPYYNNYGNYLYPQNYSYSPQVTPVVAPQQSPQNPGIVWVQGESGAKSYLVGANQSVLLMDSEAPVFYVKSADASGMPMPLRAFDYTERSQQPVVSSTAEPVDMSEYVTRDQFEKAHDEMKKLIDSLKTSITKEGSANAKKSTV